MKKLFLGALMLVMFVVPMVFLVGCGGNGGNTTTEPNLRHLLVTQYEKAESENWTLDQFFYHADSERTPHFIDLGVGRFRTKIPSIYHRVINIDTGNVTHEFIDYNRLRRETPYYSNLSFTHSGFFGVGDTTPDFDVIEDIYARARNGNRIIEAGTISFRVVNIRG